VEQTSAQARGQIYMVSGNWIVLFGFLPIDLAFLGSNLLKIPEGGWLPILIGLLLSKLMTTRRTGAGLLARQIPATSNTEDVTVTFHAPTSQTMKVGLQVGI